MKEEEEKKIAEKELLEPPEIKRALEAPVREVEEEIARARTKVDKIIPGLDLEMPRAGDVLEVEIKTEIPFRVKMEVIKPLSGGTPWLFNVRLVPFEGERRTKDDKLFQQQKFFFDLINEDLVYEETKTGGRQKQKIELIKTLSREKEQEAEKILQQPEITEPEEATRRVKKQKDDIWKKNHDALDTLARTYSPELKNQLWGMLAYRDTKVIVPTWIIEGMVNQIETLKKTKSRNPLLQKFDTIALDGLRTLIANLKNAAQTAVRLPRDMQPFGINTPQKIGAVLREKKIPIDPPSVTFQEIGNAFAEMMIDLFWQKEQIDRKVILAQIRTMEMQSGSLLKYCKDLVPEQKKARKRAEPALSI